MCSGLDEGSDQVADHVVEKSCGGDSVDDERAFGVPMGVGDGADVGVGLMVWVRRYRVSAGTGGYVWVKGGEGGEVVSSHDVGCGLVERGTIEGPRAGPDVGSEN